MRAFALILTIFSCFYVVNNSVAAPPNFYEVPYNSTVTVDEHGVCKQVTNNHASTQKLFVPTKTSGEWLSFRNNTPAGVACNDCCKTVWQSCSGMFECCTGDSLYCATNSSNTCELQISYGAACDQYGPSDQCAGFNSCDIDCSSTPWGDPCPWCCGGNCTWM